MARNVFLSFVEEDILLANAFRAQAKNENSQLEFADYSVKEAFNSTNSDYIKNRIKEKISHASVLLCLIGNSTSRSHWVNWEIETAVILGKGILGVRLKDITQFYVPEALTKRGAVIVGWDHKQIINAIEKVAVKAGY